MRDMSELEKLGVPTVGWTAAMFSEDAHWSAKIFGIPELAIAEVPLPFTNRTPEALAEMIDEAMGRVVEALTTSPEPVNVSPSFEHVVLCSDPELSYEGDDLLAAWDAMNSEFVANGWSDGMPLVAPTQEKVAAMVAASGREADELVGIFAPGNGIGTVGKVAANAVMAGCAPEAMPVVLAMAEAALDPKIGLRTWAMSTGPQAPVVMVSGPIADEIGMNHGICALGPGSISQVNVAIGRTLRLLMLNVGHAYPGAGDMDTIGSAMKFSACVAENEAASPWEPYRVQQGYDREDSTVTINVPYGACELFDFQNHDPELLIENFSTVATNSCGSPSNGVWLVKTPADLSAGYPFSGAFHNLILLAPEHADVFGQAGWTIDDIRHALWEKCKLPFRQLMLNQPVQSFEISHPELRHLLDAPETLVPVFPDESVFDIFVVGADAGRSLFFFGGTLSVTAPVRR